MKRGATEGGEVRDRVKLTAFSFLFCLIMLLSTLALDWPSLEEGEGGAGRGRGQEEGGERREGAGRGRRTVRVGNCFEPLVSTHGFLFATYLSRR